MSRQWKVEGETAGWRVLDDRLPDIPTRLVQRSLTRLKARRHRRRERHRRAQRVHVGVLKRDALWSQDATHLGRCEGQAVWAEVMKDVGTCKTLDLVLQGRASGSADVIAMLETLY